MPASGNTTPALLSYVRFPTISSSGSIAICISERDEAKAFARIIFTGRFSFSWYILVIIFACSIERYRSTFRVLFFKERILDVGFRYWISDIIKFQILPKLRKKSINHKDHKGKH